MKTMQPALDDTTLENEWVQLGVKEAVRFALESPLREPILEAVAEETDAAPDTSDDGSSSRGGPSLRAAAVAVVAGAMLYLILRQRRGGD